MQAVGAYLMSVTAVALICGAGKKLIPGGTVGGVIRMMTGCLLLLAVVQPLIRMKPLNWEDYMEDFEISADQYIADGKEIAQKEMRESITARVCSYIQDKANELDTVLAVEVRLSDEELPVPVEVTLTGNVSPYAKRMLSEYLESTFGIGTEGQIWIT